METFFISIGTMFLSAILFFCLKVSGEEKDFSGNFLTWALATLGFVFLALKTI